MVNMGGESFFLSTEAWALRKYILTAGYLEHFRSENANDKQYYCVDTFNSSKSGNGTERRGAGRMPHAFGSGSGAIGTKLIKVAIGKPLSDRSSDEADLPAGAGCTPGRKEEGAFPPHVPIV